MDCTEDPESNDVNNNLELLRILLERRSYCRSLGKSSKQWQMAQTPRWILTSKIVLRASAIIDI